MTETRTYRVECYRCREEFITKGTDISIELDEEYTEDDFWFVHTYRAFCPFCMLEVVIDILDDHKCCDL